MFDIFNITVRITREERFVLKFSSFNAEKKNCISINIF